MRHRHVHSTGLGDATRRRHRRPHHPPPSTKILNPARQAMFLPHVLPMLVPYLLSPSISIVFPPPFPVAGPYQNGHASLAPMPELAPTASYHAPSAGRSSTEPCTRSVSTPLEAAPPWSSWHIGTLASVQYLSTVSLSIPPLAIDVTTWAPLPSTETCRCRR